MGIQVPEARPSAFSNWGDNNLDPSNDIVQPPSPQQQAGWAENQRPPAPWWNWLEWITNRWIKNLDVRSPRIPMMKWFVGGQSGAHFADLPSALASGSVLNGDWIYFSPSNSNAFLAASITIGKSVKIFCEPGTRFYKTNPAATRALIITAADCEIFGAEFSSGWSDPGDAAIEITARRCRVIKCNFDSSITQFIKDDGVPAGDAPVLSQNLVEV